MALIEIDGLPFLKMVIFPWRTVSHNQSVFENGEPSTFGISTTGYSGSVD